MLISVGTAAHCRAGVERAMRAGTARRGQEAAKRKVQRRIFGLVAPTSPRLLGPDGDAGLDRFPAGLQPTLDHRMTTEVHGTAWVGRVWNRSTCRT